MRAIFFLRIDQRIFFLYDLRKRKNIKKAPFGASYFFNQSRIT